MSRILRCLVCLVLICSLLINCSPIKAKAVAVEASIAIGIIAMMILASAGVVYTASTTNQIQAIGNSFQTHMYQWGTSAEKLDEVDAFFNGLHLYYPGSGDDDETPHDKQVRLARGILAGITAWVASLALGMIDIEETLETAPEGYAYYGEILAPALPNYNSMTYPYTFVGRSSSDAKLFLYVSSAPFNARTYSGQFDFSLANYGTSTISYARYEVSNGFWIESDGSNLNTGKFISGSYDLVWSDYDINDKNGTLYVATGPAPFSAMVETIDPIYVGDIPDQLQSGELEPEAIPLPDINLEPYIEDGQLAPQKVIDTMSNLSTGALPYDQFLQQSTLPPEIDDGGTDSDSGTSSDTWQPPSNPGQFALDLTKYFPFCIPFDLYDLFTCLNADPVAPVIRWELPMPGGSTYPIELDLSPFNSVAQLLRRMQLLLFCVGLAIKTRDLIKG